MHFLFLALAACDQSNVKLNEEDSEPVGDTDTDTDTDADADADGDTDTDTDTDTVTAFPDVSDQMDPDTSHCETWYYGARAGAKYYWWAEYHGSQTDGWDGIVHLQLYANETWEAEGGADCEAQWTMSAEAQPISTCADCDFGILAQGFVDRANTTCGEEVYFNYQSLSWLNEVRLRDGGSAEWFYYGYSYGSGFWAGEDVNDLSYMGAAACLWF